MGEHGDSEVVLWFSRDGWRNTFASPAQLMPAIKFLQNSQSLAHAVAHVWSTKSRFEKFYSMGGVFNVFGATARVWHKFRHKFGVLPKVAHPSVCRPSFLCVALRKGLSLQALC
jgi:hypothetical protein